MNLPKALLYCVGQTPRVKLRGLIENPDISLFAKLEGQNPTGSIKDRIAKAIVEDAEKRGAIEKAKHAKRGRHVHKLTVEQKAKMISTVKELFPMRMGKH